MELRGPPLNPPLDKNLEIDIEIINGNTTVVQVCGEVVDKLVDNLKREQNKLVDEGKTKKTGLVYEKDAD